MTEAKQSMVHLPPYFLDIFVQLSLSPLIFKPVDKLGPVGHSGNWSITIISLLMVFLSCKKLSIYYVLCWGGWVDILMTLSEGGRIVFLMFCKQLSYIFDDKLLYKHQILNHMRLSYGCLRWFLIFKVFLWRWVGFISYI